MKTSEAFRKTKEHLWDGIRPMPGGKAPTVYNAARHAGVNDIVKPIIMELLRPSIFLAAWLLRNHGIDAWADIRRYQKTKHAWIDHLIEHYESLGD